MDVLPPGMFVLEVLDTVDLTDKVVEVVQVLLEAGLLILLDDFVDD